jgi:hypothetical protein
MKRLYLYPFRYRSPLTGKWVKARYVAERHEIKAQHTEWEIIGPPEIPEVGPNARHFHPSRVIAHADLRRLQEQPPQTNPHLEQPPAIDPAERYLVALFLRRYVTYCARRKCVKQMHAAAGLYREVTASTLQ